MPNATASAKPAIVVHSVTKEWRSSGAPVLRHGVECLRRRRQDELVDLEDPADKLPQHEQADGEQPRRQLFHVSSSCLAHLGDLGAQLVHDVGEARLEADVEVARPRQVDRLGQHDAARGARS